jgi:hypothetical protein
MTLKIKPMIYKIAAGKTISITAHKKLLDTLYANKKFTTRVYELKFVIDFFLKNENFFLSHCIITIARHE